MVQPDAMVEYLSYYGAVTFMATRLLKVGCILFNSLGLRPRLLGLRPRSASPSLLRSILFRRQLYGDPSVEGGVYFVQLARPSASFNRLQNGTAALRLKSTFSLRHFILRPFDQRDFKTPLKLKKGDKITVLKCKNPAKPTDYYPGAPHLLTLLTTHNAFWLLPVDTLTSGYPP